MATKTLYWPDENLQQDIDDAALYLNYRNEIEDPENSGEMISNPNSKVQTIMDKLTATLQEIVIAGAAKRSDSYRTDAIAEATERTQNITFT